MMENFSLKVDEFTPEVILNTNGEFSIIGKSYPENSFEFYKPVTDWIIEYFDGNMADNTIVTLDLAYFNSSTSKVLFDLFDFFDENREKCTIEINWVYDKDDESSQEAGEDLVEDFENLKINLVEK